MEWLELQKKTKEKLDEVSPSFCLAKWLQVTLHLQTGFTHSCHHPVPHKIPLKEVENDYRALHNTSFKRKMRQLMLDGECPSECNYCWDIEKSSLADFSDRIIKSSDLWAKPYLDEVLASGDGETIVPRYLEVSFGYNCNLGCIYCSPDVSSTIWKDFKKNGAFPTIFPENELAVLEAIGKKPYGIDEKNPYVDAFWKWFPEIKEELKIFRITGGEPLINKNTFKLFKNIEDEPMPDVDLSVNSNLMVSDKIFTDFTEAINSLLRTNKINSFLLYTSVDGSGRGAEFIRDGLVYDKFLLKVERFLEKVDAPVTVMVTYTLLSATDSFIQFLKDFLEISKKLCEKNNKEINRLNLDISYLHQPEYLSVRNVTDELYYKMEEQLRFMKNNSLQEGVKYGFTDYEVNKLERTLNVACENRFSKKKLLINRYNFHKMIESYSFRRGKNFAKSFPDLRYFYKNCLRSQDIAENSGWSNHYVVKLQMGLCAKRHHPLMEKEIEGWKWGQSLLNTLENKSIKLIEGFDLNRMNINKPISLDLSFGNECDLFCSYCSADDCSQIRILNSKDNLPPIFGDLSVEELLESYGISLNDQKVHVEKFWEALPSFYGNLREVKLTGGEPLQNKNIFKFVEELDRSPLPQLKLILESSLAVKEEVIHNFYKKVMNLLKENKIAVFDLVTSMDTGGAQANYTRGGVDYDLWVARVHTFLEEFNGNLTIKINYTIFSCGDGFKIFLNYLISLREKFGSDRLDYEFSYGYKPDYLNIAIGTDDIFERTKYSLEYLKEKFASATFREGFKPSEIRGFESILERGKSERVVDEEKLRNIHLHLNKFIKIYDFRTKMKFRKEFNELGLFVDHVFWKHLLIRTQVGYVHTSIHPTLFYHQLGWDMRTNPVTLLNHAMSDPIDGLEQIVNNMSLKQASLMSFDISLDNYCMNYCTYCSADDSSKIMADRKKNGRYNLLDWQDEVTILEKQKCDIVPSSETLLKLHNLDFSKAREIKITGGDPFVSPNFDSFFEYLPPGLKLNKLGIESSLSHESGLLKKKLARCMGCAESIHIITTMDSYGEQGEYIRGGVSFKKWVKNVEYLLAETTIFITVKICYTLFSASNGFVKLINYLILLRQRPDCLERIRIQFIHVYKPKFLCIANMDSSLREVLKKQEVFLRSKKRNEITQRELDDFNKIVLVAENNRYSAEDVVSNRVSFFQFVDQYDRRYRSSFYRTFPELQKYYEDSKEMERLILRSIE